MMTWIGYTTHHLFGNITIALFILLIWWFNRIKLDDSRKNIVIMITIVLAFSITFVYTIYLRDNPEMITKLF